MKEFYLDLHSEKCKCHPDNKKTKTQPKDNKGYYLASFHHFCEKNPNRFLFFAGTEFFLITYHSCVATGNDYDFKVELVKNVIKDYTVLEYYDVDRFTNLDEDLRRFRLRNKELKKHIRQTNYLYNNAAGHPFAICTTAEYLDVICDNEKIEENYNIAKKYLIEKGYDHLLDDLKLLKQSNIVYYKDGVETFKTIESLIKQINKLTK